jgi:hypothetical protein
MHNREMKNMQGVEEQVRWGKSELNTVRCKNMGTLYIGFKKAIIRSRSKLIERRSKVIERRNKIIEKK